MNKEKDKKINKEKNNKQEKKIKKKNNEREKKIKKKNNEREKKIKKNRFSRISIKDLFNTLDKRSCPQDSTPYTI